MREMKRAIHIDFHTMPGICNFNESWDPERFAVTLQRAQVRYVNMFAKCNEGFAYYPTKIGVPYAGMQGDMFGDLLRECHKRDIGVSAYLNVGYDHEQAHRHREWRVLPEQFADPYGIAKYFIDMCYYHGGYRDYLLAMTREVRDRYDVDGFFFDCMSLNPCYGIECIESMRAAGMDPADPAQVLQHAADARMDFCREAHELVGSGKYMYFNGVPYRQGSAYDTHIEIEGLPGGQGYDYFPAQMAYARTIQKKVLYMTARFQMSWADFGGMKSKASLENDAWDALMNGAEVMVGDHMHPAENLEPEVYQTIGEVYQDVRRLEQWTDGATYVADIGVLAGNAGGDGSMHTQLTEAHKGAARMLGELKYGFDIVSEENDLSKYRLLVLPDDIRITPTLEEKLRTHLAAGKGILASGLSGLDGEGRQFVLPEWGAQLCGLDEFHDAYFRMPELGSMRHSMYAPGVQVKPAPGAEARAEYIRPYFARHWDGLRGYYYTPPEKATGHAALIACGNVRHICFKVFEAYYTHALLAHKALVRQCIEELLSEPSLKTCGIPSYARVTLTEKGPMRLVHVKVTHPEPRGTVDVIEEHQTLPAGAQVWVQGRYERAFLAPEGAEVALSQEGKYVRMTLPEITGYCMIVLE